MTTEEKIKGLEHLLRKNQAISDRFIAHSEKNAQFSQGGRDGWLLTKTVRSQKF